MRYRCKRRRHFPQVVLCQPDGFQLTRSEFIVEIGENDVQVSLCDSTEDEPADKVLPLVQRQGAALGFRLSLSVKLFDNFRSPFSYCGDGDEFVIVGRLTH